MLKIFAIAVIVASGCIESTSVQCSFGLCPTGSTCDEDAKQCIPAGCGNGVIEGTEQCDGAIDPDRANCLLEGYYSPTGLACSKECTYDATACQGGICGDHTVNGPELCDGMPPTGATCADFGFQLGRLGCSVDCSLAIGNCARLGWQPSSGNAPDEVHAVWGYGQDKLFGVGRGGHIIQGNGVVWIEVASPTTNDLNGVWGTSATDVYAVGAAGTIVHYDGTTWTAMTSGTTADLDAINGTTTDMWIVGSGGTILHSPTSAAAWTPEASGVAVALRGVWAEGATTAVAVGDAATTGSANPTALYRNAGTWTAMTTQTIQAPAAVTVSLDAVWGSGAGFVAVGTATTASNHGVVLQVNLASSTTWGFTGQSITASDLKSVWGIVTNRTDIYIGGLQGALIHYDGVPGPTHFYAYDSNTTRGIRGLWGTGPAFVRAATLGGEVQEYNGTDLAKTDFTPVDPQLVTKSFNAVWADPTSGVTIAVGDAGRITRHDNTGWSTPGIAGSSAAPWNAVWGAGMIVALAGGNATNGLVMSNNGGGVFGAASLTSVNWQALWGTSGSDIYAVGTASGATPTGALAHWNGASWTQQPDVGNKRLNGIWGTSDGDIFVVGSQGVIYHFDGAAWAQQNSTLPTNISLNAVWGAAGNDVFAVGGAGTILHYDGTAWRKMTSGTGQDLYAVGGTNHSDVFAGGRGTLLHWGGISWSQMGIDFEDVFGMWIQRDFSYLAGDIAGSNNLVDAGAFVFGRTPLGAKEGICNDPWDNDGDGLVGCADQDCVTFAGCIAGGACAPTTPIACGETTAGASTYTGIARIDDLPCLDHATPGPEASYRLVADHTGMITVTLDSQAALDLVQLDPFDASSVTMDRRISCDVGHCVAAPGASGMRTLTFAATAGETYYLLVDGPANTAAAFTLVVSCP